jgi:hypothetical protein
MVGGRKQYDPPGYLAVLRSADTSAEKKEAQLKSVKQGNRLVLPLSLTE